MNKHDTNHLTNSNNTIFHDFTINASSKKVFDAVSDPEHLVNWWPDKCSGKPEAGALYNFYFTPEYDWYGTVHQLEPAQLFTIKMTDASPDWVDTEFGFKLSEKDNQTYVEFFHSNWPQLNAHFRIASFCWAMLLKGLKDYVESGIVIPFEKRS